MTPNRRSVQILDENESAYDIIQNIIKSKKQEMSFYILDLNDINRKLEMFKMNLPRVEIFYAMKSNPDPDILKYLISQNISFDCASKDEIKTVLRYGCTPDKIIYSHTAKPIPSLREAKQHKVEMTIFDSEDELYKIKEVYPESKLLLRINKNDPTSDIEIAQKFGADIYEETPRLLELAKKLGLNVIGVAFHLGCMYKNPNIVYESIKESRNIFDIGESLGFEMSVLDIGGGVTGLWEQSSLILKIFENINEALEEYFPNNGKRLYRIIAEPGRFLNQTSCHLLTPIIHSRKSKNQMVYRINESVYCSFHPMMFKRFSYLYNPKPILSGKNDEKKYRSIICGTSCDPDDIILENIMLPEMTRNDWILWENKGCYCFSCASNFNQLDKPEIITVATPEILKSLMNYEAKQKKFKMGLISLNDNE